MISFEKFSKLECENKHSSQLCSKYKNNEQILNLSLKKDIYEIQFETKLLFTDKIQNFVYDFNLYDFTQKKKINNSGFMIEKNEKFYKQNIINYFEKDFSFTSKKFVLDFRNYNRPSFGNLKLKMIKDQTFIKDLIIHVNRRCNFLVKFYYEYRSFILIIGFFVLLGVLNFFYFLLFFIIYFFRIANFLESINLGEEKNGEIEKTGYMKKIMSLMFF